MIRPPIHETRWQEALRRLRDDFRCGIRLLWLAGFCLPMAACGSMPGHSPADVVAPGPQAKRRRKKASKSARAPRASP